MIPFNYHHLYYFHTIAAEGSVTQAARKLRLSQSSLSMQLAQFENFLEKKLFVREGKKLVLTEDGSHILAYAKAIFDLGRELSDSLGDRVDKNRLRIQIGVSAHIPKAFVDSILNFLMDQSRLSYTNVVEKSMSGMMADLKVHKLDMVLNDLPHQAPAEEGVENHLIAKIPVALYANQELAKCIHRFPKDLNGAPVILPTAHSQTYHAIQEFFLTHKIKPHVIAEVQDLELVRRLVLKGRGIAPLNELTILKAPAKEKLKKIGDESRLKIYDFIYLIRKTRKIPHPLVTKILETF